MDASAFTLILSVLGLTIIAMIICRYLKLPAILGYLIIGILCGPHGMAWIQSTSYIEKLAEFGVVLLMFMVGLEFSINKLIQLRFNVLVLGSLQVILSMGITISIASIIGMPITQSIIIGGIIAMSSTAIVIKQLNDQHELNTRYGLNSVGILLFQDLAVIPFFIIITALSKHNQNTVGLEILWAILKGVVTVGAMLLLGRWIFRPIFRIIVNTKIREIFTLFAILMTLLSAWLTSKAGLSPSLGAFIGGILIGESEYRHQIEVEIRPFRDILMGLFFISIGLMLNVQTWQESWVWILLLLAGIVLGKTLLIMLITRIFGHARTTAFRTAIILAQGGEFGFAVLLLALNYQLIPTDYGQVILAALILSFAIAPIIIQFNQQIVEFIFRTKKDQSPVISKEDIKSLTGTLKDHVVLIGFGRVGQNIANVLTQEKLHYIGVDIDPNIIKNARLAGQPVIYGDATHPDLLSSLKLGDAKALLISTRDIKGSIEILDHVRLANTKLPILVRCSDNIEYQQLQGHGATQIITETFEESLTLAYYLLHEIHISSKETTSAIHQARAKQYHLLRRVFRGSGFEQETENPNLGEILQPFQLPENSYAINKKLKAFINTNEGATIIGLRQKNHKPKEPKPNTILHASDILILFGTPEAIEKLETKLVNG